MVLNTLCVKWLQMQVDQLLQFIYFIIFILYYVFLPWIGSPKTIAEKSFALQNKVNNLSCFKDRQACIPLELQFNDIKEALQCVHGLHMETWLDKLNRKNKPAKILKSKKAEPHNHTLMDQWLL